MSNLKNDYNCRFEVYLPSNNNKVSHHRNKVQEESMHKHAYNNDTTVNIDSFGCDQKISQEEGEKLKFKRYKKNKSCQKKTDFLVEMAQLVVKLFNVLNILIDFPFLKQGKGGSNLLQTSMHFTNIYKLFERSIFRPISFTFFMIFINTNIVSLRFIALHTV